MASVSMIVTFCAIADENCPLVGHGMVRSGRKPLCSGECAKGSEQNHGGSGRGGGA